MNRDHIHHFSKDNRRAEVYFVKTMEYFEVEMYEDEKLVDTVVMMTDGVIHCERYAEDAAENWVHGWPVELLPKEYVAANDN